MTFLLDPNVHTVASEPRLSRQFTRKQYMDKQFMGGEAEWKKKVDRSSTVYVGNMSCFTSEYQVHELFSRCGSIKRIIMGLDRNKKTPCGFCFVEFDECPAARKSIKYLHGVYLDGRDLQVDIDGGFQEGRQYGRGNSGGQIGDERRREREQGGAHLGARGGSHGGVASLLTRSITIVALISILLIAHQPEQATSDIVIKPYNIFLPPRYTIDQGRYVSIKSVREAQLNGGRDQYEKNFAQFLVNLMKAAKPTLLKAFIQATLDDKQLKEVAIGLFFNTTSTDSDDR